MPDPTDTAAIETWTRKLAHWWQHEATWTAIGISPGLEPGFQFESVAPADNYRQPYAYTLPDHQEKNTHLLSKAEQMQLKWEASNKLAYGHVHYWTRLPDSLREFRYDQLFRAGNRVRESQARIRATMRGRYKYLWRPASFTPQTSTAAEKLVEVFGEAVLLAEPHSCSMCLGKDQHVMSRLRVTVDGLTLTDETKHKQHLGAYCHDGYANCFCSLLEYCCHAATAGECDGEDEHEHGNCHVGEYDCYCADEACCHGGYHGDGCDDYCTCPTCEGEYCQQGQGGCTCDEDGECCHEYATSLECSDECQCTDCEERRAEADAEAEQEAEEEEVAVV